MKTKPLSDTMIRTIDAIRAGGGSASPEGGGWWKGADGQRLEFPGELFSSPHYKTLAVASLPESVTTGTIYALERRGILKRTGLHRAAHRDTYVLVDQLETK